MLIQYVRKPGKEIEFINALGEKETKYLKGKPFGCMVSVVQGDTISLGWSLCSPRDEWDRDVAQSIAWARATMCQDLVKNNPDLILTVPQSLARDFEDFMFRSMKYFQTDELTLDYAYEYIVAQEEFVMIKAVKLF